MAFCKRLAVKGRKASPKVIPQEFWSCMNTINFVTTTESKCGIIIFPQKCITVILVKQIN